MKVSPSILGCDLLNLETELKMIEKAGADMVHLDVMDGVFVPNITFGFDIIKSIKKKTKLPIDVHLMIDQPEKKIEQFISCGADYLTFHIESSNFPIRTTSLIRSLGCRAGIAISPKTNEFDLRYLVNDIDLVLVMTVEPGYQGQPFLYSQIEKIKSIKKMLIEAGSNAKISVDGGVSDKNIKDIKSAGADIVISSGYIFGSSDYAKAISNLKS